jgi:hypothetical protein
VEPVSGLVGDGEGEAETIWRSGNLEELALKKDKCPVQRCF